MHDLRGKVAIITGCSYGIGYSIAEKLGSQGAAIMLTDITDRVFEAQQALEANGITCAATLVDVRDKDSVDKCIQYAAKKFGSVDILINNAAMQRSPELILEQSAETWDTTMAVNVRGTLFCIQSAAKQMIAQGNGGRIVCIASTAALKPYKRRASYCTSKAAIVQLAKVAGLELADHNITVNTVCPGQTVTENLVKMTTERGLSPDEAKEMRQRQAQIPLGPNSPDDIANAVSYFASSGAGTTTGQVITVDGGGLMV